MSTPGRVSLCLGCPFVGEWFFGCWLCCVVYLFRAVLAVSLFLIFSGAECFRPWCWWSWSAFRAVAIVLLYFPGLFLCSFFCRYGRRKRLSDSRSGAGY